MASQVFWPCMREKPENIDSNEAVNMVAEHSVPAAKKAIYDIPATDGSSAPSPYPSPKSRISGSARLESTEATKSLRQTRKLRRQTAIQRISRADPGR